VRCGPSDSLEKFSAVTGCATANMLFARSTEVAGIMESLKRLLKQLDMEQLWLEWHHVPLAEVADDVRFYCPRRSCERFYSVYDAIHIGFHCPHCHLLLYIVDDC
jgi:hypothetical protein